MTTPGLAGFIADGDDPQTWDDVVAAVLEALATGFERGARARRAATAAVGADLARHLRLAAAQGRPDPRVRGRARRRRTAAVRRRAAPVQPASDRDAAGDRLAGVPPAPAARTCRTARSRPASRASSRRAPCSPSSTVTTRDRRVPAAQRGRQDGRPAAASSTRRSRPGRIAPGAAAAPADDHRGPRLPGPGPPRRPPDRRRPRRAGRHAAAARRRAARARPPPRRLLEQGRHGHHRRHARRRRPRRPSCCGCSTPIEANVPGVLADIDTEFLHDLRVSVRRTRSALKLFGDALAPACQRADEAGVLRRRVQVGRRPDHADQGPGRAPARLRGDRARRSPRRSRTTWSRSAPTWSSGGAGSSAR